MRLTELDEGILVVDGLDPALVILAASTAIQILEFDLEEVADLGQEGKCEFLRVLVLSEAEVNHARLHDVTT